MLIEFEERDDPTRNIPKRMIALAIAACIAVGGTLASNISLGTGAPLEFGQGVKVLTTCAPNVPIYLKPEQAFVNAPGYNAKFSFSGISLDGIQNSCIGYDFLIKAYGETGSALSLYDTNKSEIRIYQSSGSNFSKYSGNGFTIAAMSFGYFRITFDVPVSLSNQVYRLTLETAIHDGSALRYSVGDTGPEGGTIVLLPNSPGNNTGQYFEAKSINSNVIWCDAWPIDIPGATGTAIGTGAANTNAITSACNSGAGWDATYVSGSPGDWFLPSTGELEATFNAGFIPQLGSASYWTSTQYDGDDAYSVSWPGVSTNTYLKIGRLPVVVLRSFF